MTDAKLEEIRNFVIRVTPPGKHNFAHIERVRNNAIRFAKILGVSNLINLNVLQAACYLHDITYLKYKNNPITYFFEGHLARRALVKLLPKFEVSGKEADIIINACFRHTHSFPFGQLNRNQDIYTKLLQDSDTIDFFHPVRINNKIPTIVEYFLKYGKKNLAHYLNFPQLHDKAD